MGFVKVAMLHGYVTDALPDVNSHRPIRADLVPVFSFGENDVRGA